jgi:hypothetical protein
MGSGSNMTYEQAVEMATKMHQQGISYPKIEDHFKKIGYRSSRTKKPVGALAIRHMVKSTELKDKKQDLAEEKVMHVVSGGFRDTVRKLSDLNVDDDTFASLLKALVEKHERNGAG